MSEPREDVPNGEELTEGHVDETPATPEAPAAEPTEDAAAETVEGHSEDLNIGQERVLELISYIVVNLVDHPDDVTVDIVDRQGREIYQVRVHSDDLGKVIGKGGQTARALRVLLMAVSANTDQRIGLEIVE